MYTSRAICTISSHTWVFILYTLFVLNDSCRCCADILQKNYAMISTTIVKEQKACTEYVPCKCITLLYFDKKKNT